MVKFEWTIKISDLLTSLAILVSFGALVFSWSQYRDTLEIDLADRIRSAAAEALIQIDRWRLLSESLYSESQPIYVETSELLESEFNITKARDHLWKKINEKRNDIHSKILDERIFTSYVGLMPYFPEVRDHFISTLHGLRDLEHEISVQYLASLEQDVISFYDDEIDYQSAMLGNKLRSTSELYQTELMDRSEQIIGPIRSYLLDVIAEPNWSALNARRSQ